MRLKFWKREEVAPHVVSDPPGEDAPRQLGPYRLVKEIGRGSMGVVYLGRDEQTGREAAVKVMVLADYVNPNAVGDIREQFLREARMLAWLDHPDIVSIFDAGEEHGALFIAMEIIHGEKLSGFTRPGHLLPLPKVLEIAARVADVLGYADEQSIAHRDIKPGNIMYDAATDVVKVMDFGISRMTHASASLLDTVQGSPRYMSPEQIRGKTVDGRSDLFSLGIVLYQMVSGSLPFEGDSELEVMRRIIKEPHTDILSVKPDIPPCVCGIINRALQKEADLRYGNGREMAADIRRCLASL